MAMTLMYSIRWTSSSTCSTRSTWTTNWTSCWRTFKRTTLMCKMSNKDLPSGRRGSTIVGWIPDMFSLNSNRFVLWFGRQYHLSTHLRSLANHNPHLHHRGFNHLRSVRLTVLLSSRNCWVVNVVKHLNFPLQPMLLAPPRIVDWGLLQPIMFNVIQVNFFW